MTANQFFKLCVFFVLNFVCLYSFAQDAEDVNTDTIQGVDTLEHSTMYNRFATIVKAIEHAAEQGDTVAQNMLGDYCYNGKFVKQSYEEAAKWWRMAAEQGCARAQYNLALLYFKGQGVEKLEQECDLWLKKAADQGYEPAVRFSSLRSGRIALDEAKARLDSYQPITVPKMPQLPKVRPVKIPKTPQIRPIPQLREVPSRPLPKVRVPVR